jgi:hypothetical protein
MTSTTLRSEVGHPVGGPIGELVQSVEVISAWLELGTMPVKRRL